MGWLPFESPIAAKGEELILKYNPKWTGYGDTRKPVWIPEQYNKYFDITFQKVSDINVTFTRDGWNGRMKSCRSMAEESIKAWEKEHRQMLLDCAGEEWRHVYSE